MKYRVLSHRSRWIVTAYLRDSETFVMFADVYSTAS